MSQSFPTDIKKNKLKWAGDLEGLKLFISDELKLKGKLKSPCGGTRQFLSEHLTVTWYMTNKTQVPTLLLAILRLTNMRMRKKPMFLTSKSLMH